MTRPHRSLPASVLVPLIMLLPVATLVSGCGQQDAPLAPESSHSASGPDAGLETSLAAGVTGADAASDGASTTAAVEIDGPIVITSPGQYRVVRDFSVAAKAGDAIVIRSNDVHLSLGGHTIEGPGNKVGRGVVVDGASNVTVSGGTLRTFGVGVALLGASQSEVSGVWVEGGDEFADPPAIPPQIGLLLVNSTRNNIRGNRFSMVNLGIFVRGGGSYENRIAQNHASAGANGLLGICYNPAMGEGPAGPQRDFVLRNDLAGFGGGIQASEQSTDNRFVANTIRYLEFAWEDRNGSNVFRGNRGEDLTP